MVQILFYLVIIVQIVQKKWVTLCCHYRCNGYSKHARHPNNGDMSCRSLRSRPLHNVCNPVHRFHHTCSNSFPIPPISVLKQYSQLLKLLYNSEYNSATTIFNFINCTSTIENSSVPNGSELLVLFDNAYFGAIFSKPPIYGRNTSGIVMDPSASW